MPHLDSKSSELEPRAEKSRAQLAVLWSFHQKLETWRRMPLLLPWPALGL